MRSHQLEKWVLDILEKVTLGQPQEDSRIELKADWIDDEKAARRIAGHANAARGDPILWIIGADERRKTVIGAKIEELANWWPNVQSYFSELPPQMALSLNIPYGDNVVVAMLFDTERAPFVVKNPNFGNPNGGPVEYEVPWREGTSTRSAKRADLLRLLSPLQSLPEFEVLDGLFFVWKKLTDETLQQWNLKLTLYVDTPSIEPIIIPFHRCKINFNNPWIIDQMKLEDIELRPPESSSGGYPGRKNISRTIEATGDEVLIYGSGKLYFTAEFSSENILIDHSSDIVLSISLNPVKTDRSAMFNVKMNAAPPEKDENMRWVFG